MSWSAPPEGLRGIGQHTGAPTVPGAARRPAHRDPGPRCRPPRHPVPDDRQLTVVRYYVAEADWGLIFGDVNNPGDTYLGAYARFRLYDDNGVCRRARLSRRTTTSSMTHTSSTAPTATGKLTEVRYRLPFIDLLIPDGYWELRAVVYNKYDQPGNVWKLRIRVENRAPYAATEFAAVPIATDASGTTYSGLDLYWMPGAERDRQKYVSGARSTAARTKSSPNSIRTQRPTMILTLSETAPPPTRTPIACTAQDIGGLWGDDALRAAPRFRPSHPPRRPPPRTLRPHDHLDDHDQLDHIDDTVGVPVDRGQQHQLHLHVTITGLERRHRG